MAEPLRLQRLVIPEGETHLRHKIAEITHLLYHTATSVGSWAPEAAEGLSPASNGTTAITTLNPTVGVRQRCVRKLLSSPRFPLTSLIFTGSKTGTFATRRRARTPTTSLTVEPAAAHRQADSLDRPTLPAPGRRQADRFPPTPLPSAQPTYQGRSLQKPTPSPPTTLPPSQSPPHPLLLHP